MPLTKYKYIDSLRGYAALLVILVHSGIAFPAASIFLQSLIKLGAYGVTLFYVVSSLTLSMSWNARNSCEKNPVINFFIRRIFRIVPMFYCAIVIYIFLYGMSPRYWAPNGIEWWHVILTIFFINGFHPETISSVVPGGWSIAVEMNFYILLPFIASHIRKYYSMCILLLISLIASVLLRAFLKHFIAGYYPHDLYYMAQGFAYMNFITQLPVFIVGIITYYSIADRKFFLIIPISALISSLLLYLIIINYSISIKLINYGAIVVAIFFSMIILILQKYPHKIIVNNLVAFIGKISYSMYLLHIVIIELYKHIDFSYITNENIRSITYYICIIFSTVLVASIFYVAIERPGIYMGKCIISYFDRKSNILNP